jgi:hypothetical protein
VFPDVSIVIDEVDRDATLHALARWIVSHGL